MTVYAYNPTTLELINTNNIADWMGTTDVPPPEFDPEISGCFWRDDHWEIVVADPPEPPVYICTAWQIRKMLNAAGLRQAVEDAVAASTDQNLKDGWEFATEIHSNDPFVISMGAALGFTASETAELIRQASEL